jgi:hypothetical protein
MVFEATQADGPDTSETFRFVERQIMIIAGIQNQASSTGIIRAHGLYGFQKQTAITPGLIGRINTHQRKLVSLLLRQQPLASQEDCWAEIFCLSSLGAFY